MRGIGPRLLWWGLLVAGLGVVLWVRSHAMPAGAELSICGFRRLTGIPCPGCGLTRAFIALARGEWSLALTYHPLSPLVAAEGFVAWVAWGRWLENQRWPASRYLNRVLLANAALLLLVWVGRLATGTLPL